MDFHYYEHPAGGESYFVGYLKSLTDSKTVNEHIVSKLTTAAPNLTLEQLFDEIPVAEKELISDRKQIQNRILHGHVAIQRGLEARQCLLVNAYVFRGRKVTVPEVEATVEGPKEALVESLDINLNIIRQRVPIPELRIAEMSVGRVSNARVAICYIDGIANETYIETLKQRIQAIDFDTIPDITLLQQMIEDNSKSLFPQLLGTERPDRISWAISTGQICVLLDGSPTAILGPANLGLFFVSYEDYFLPWIIGSILRFIRMSSVIFSVLATSFYVAVLTYHGQSISNVFLPTIISSRMNVPFPPVIEVLFMEIVIELLRESGSRLPSKIGQTIGIVGGIVLSTAAVESALASNFLLIIVALSAIASFTTPVYRMSVTIRILRFPFIFAAQLWGVLGIMLCGLAVVTHLLRLTSLGMPYLVPIYPWRAADMFDTIIRPPLSRFHHRPGFFRSPNPRRFVEKPVKRKKDIDE